MIVATAPNTPSQHKDTITSSIVGFIIPPGQMKRPGGNGCAIVLIARVVARDASTRWTLTEARYAAFIEVLGAVANRRPLVLAGSAVRLPGQSGRVRTERACTASAAC